MPDVGLIDNGEQSETPSKKTGPKRKRISHRARGNTRAPRYTKHSIASASPRREARPQGEETGAQVGLTVLSPAFRRWSISKHKPASRHLNRSGEPFQRVGAWDARTLFYLSDGRRRDVGESGHVADRHIRASASPLQTGADLFVFVVHQTIRALM